MSAIINCSRVTCEGDVLGKIRKMRVYGEYTCAIKNLVQFCGTDMPTATPSGLPEKSSMLSERWSAVHMCSEGNYGHICQERDITHCKEEPFYKRLRWLPALVTIRIHGVVSRSGRTTRCVRPRRKRSGKCRTRGTRAQPLRTVERYKHRCTVPESNITHDPTGLRAARLLPARSRTQRRPSMRLNLEVGGVQGKQRARCRGEDATPEFPWLSLLSHQGRPSRRPIWYSALASAPLIPETGAEHLNRRWTLRLRSEHGSGLVTCASAVTADT